MTNNNLLSFYDPYVYQTLSTIVGNVVTVQTIRGVRGLLKTYYQITLLSNLTELPFYSYPANYLVFLVNKRKVEEIMFKRINKLAIELPARTRRYECRAVQELLAASLEMSTLNNYMFQSFNFRNKS